MADDDSRLGHRYNSPDIIQYVDRIHAAHDEGLARAFDTPKNSEIPAIMVGPSEGKLLELFLRLVNAKKVVEVGTLAGYSAIRMAAALPEDGKLWTIENDEGHAAVARKNIEVAGMAGKIEVCVGDGVEILTSLAKVGPFDAVFVDADKENYGFYGSWAQRNLRVGGILIGDNAYLFGNLLEDDARGASMRRFHEDAAVSMFSVCIPTPDGLLLGIKR